MRALKLIRGKKPSIAPIMFAARPELSITDQKMPKSDLVWQPRPEWLRKPGARQNLWN